MAGENRPGGRRPVPTIELTAAEVAGEPDQQVDSAPAGPVPPPPPQDRAERPEAPAAEQDPPAETPRDPRRSRLLPWGLGAVAAIVLILITAWTTTLWSARDDTIVLAARLAAVEVQLQELAGRPAPPNLDGRIDDLAARTARAEATLARPSSPDPALTARLAAAENSAKSAADSLAALNRRIEDVAGAAREARGRAEAAAGQSADQTAAAAIDHRQLETLASRIAELEQAAKTMEAELARRTASADRAARLALAAAALKAAVERGEPFAAELAAARPLAGDKLAPLEPFARAGVPSVAALARELQQLTPSLLPSGAGKPQGGFFDRLQQNTERLVRIRPVGEAAGDDMSAIVARIESRAQQGDLAGALAELRKLPAEPRAPAEAWIRKAETRMQAVELSRRFATESMDALGRS